MRSFKRPSLGLAAASACALAVAACELPTSLPIWDTVWQVPADSTEVAVDKLLPASVTVVDIGGGAKAFSLTLPAAGITQTLGAVCGCAAANGTRAPKPQFTLADSATVALPTDVGSVDIVGGTIDYTITNGFSFDALNPSATAHGWLRLRVRSGSTTLATDSVSGTALTLPTGVARQRSIPIIASAAAPARLAGPLKVDITVFSPAGDSVTVNTSEQFSVSATASNLRISQASVNVPTINVAAQQDTVDLSGLKDMTSGSLTEGAIILEVQNPFAIQGSVRVDLSAPNAATVTKSLSLPVGGAAVPPATLRLALTRDEINSLAGETNCVVALNASVSAPSGAVTVTPTQKIVIKTIIEATITAGGK